MNPARLSAVQSGVCELANERLRGKLLKYNSIGMVDNTLALDVSLLVLKHLNDLRGLFVYLLNLLRISYIKLQYLDEVQAILSFDNILTLLHRYTCTVF